MREDEYTIVEDVVAPGEPATTITWSTTRPRSWCRACGRSIWWWPRGPGAVGAAAGPAPRQLHTRQRVVRRPEAAARDEGREPTRRTCTFQGGLWHIDDGRMVHASELVTVWVDPAKGAVEVPEDFWAAVEKLEGRSIAVTERAG